MSSGRKTRTVYKAELPPGVRSYYRLLQRDPCVYCGGPGGTVEHLDLEADRLDWSKWAGACARCNETRQKGGWLCVHSPRSVLEMVALRSTESERAIGKLPPRALFKIGEMVRGPFFDRGVVRAFCEDERSVEIYVLNSRGDFQELWTCNNNHVLRRADGSRIRRPLRESRP